MNQRPRAVDVFPEIIPPKNLFLGPASATDAVVLVRADARAGKITGSSEPCKVVWFESKSTARHRR
jgi:hypothetical protein